MAYDKSTFIKNIAKGYGNLNYPLSIPSYSAITAGNSSAGYYTASLYPFINSSLSAPVDMPLPYPSETFFNDIFLGGTTSAGTWIVRAYTIGTVNLTATGNQLTHHSATFPILRKNAFGNNQPINLIPFIVVTSALSTTAAQLKLEASGGGNGYINQDGNNAVGAKTFVFPSVTTAVNSGFFLRLNDGDTAIRDIIQVNVTVASSSGAAKIFGLELIQPIINFSSEATHIDNFYGFNNVINIKAGQATADIAETFLGVLRTSITSSGAFPVNGFSSVSNV